MGDVCKLLNIGLLDSESRRRVWLNLGVPTVVAPGVLVRAESRRNEDDERELVLQVCAGRYELEQPIEALIYLSSADLELISRAVVAPDERAAGAERVLLELAHGEALRGAL